MIKFNVLAHKLKWMQELVNTKTLQLTQENFFKNKFNTTYLLLRLVHHQHKLIEKQFNKY